MRPYYDDGTVTIYHGDALDVLPTLGVGAVMFALDPPYAMTPNSVRGRDDGAAGASAAPVRLLVETLRETVRLLRPGGVAAIVCDWRRVPDVSYMVTLTGLRLSGCVAWTRSRVGTGGLFRSSWDPVLIASSGTPDARDASAIPNVIAADSPHNRAHPYEKPPELWHHIAKRLPSGTVIDPFAGVGASALAAIRAGHRWIGIEIEERYCEITAQRCAQEVLPIEGVA